MNAILILIVLLCSESTDDDGDSENPSESTDLQPEELARVNPVCFYYDNVIYLC